MSNLIHWARTNLVTVICLLVIALAAVFYVVITRPAGAALRQEMAEAESLRTALQRLERGSVEAIAAEGEAEPIEISRPINEADVRQLEGIFREMATGYHDLFELAVDFNRNDHRPLVEGLFPEPLADARLFAAIMAYTQGFYNQSPDQPGLYQQLGAGTPPTDQEIGEHLALTEQNFISARGGTLLEAERAQLARAKATAHRELITNRAAEIRLYAEPPQRQNRVILAPGIFDMGEWARRTEKPAIGEVWEGQMGLWIQQDLVQAINLANHLATPSPEARVPHLPVKRVLGMTIDPQYIGVSERQTSVRGGASTPTASSSSSDSLPRNFAASPTGRVCNRLYDVRMANLSVIIDARRIPLLLDAISRINFMTPIVMSVDDVNEYQHFAEGYFYGQNVDVVQLNLQVETLWMRRWTVGHTPKVAIDEYARTNPTDTALANLTHEQAKVDYLKQKGFYDTGLMPDPVRYQLGLPTLDPEYEAKAGEAAGRSMEGYPGGYPGGMGPDGLGRPR